MERYDEAGKLTEFAHNEDHRFLMENMDFILQHKPLIIRLNQESKDKAEFIKTIKTRVVSTILIGAILGGGGYIYSLIKQDVVSKARSEIVLEKR